MGIIIDYNNNNNLIPIGTYTLIELIAEYLKYI